MSRALLNALSVEKGFLMLKKICLAVAAAGLAASVSSLPAKADNGTKVGVITCDVSSGWGFVFGSSRDLKCTFEDNNGRAERYTGHIDKFGMDIGYHAGGIIAWAVIAPSSDVGKGALAGNFGGVTASATVGVGVGAHVLLGGFKKSMMLQPVSVEGNTGLNAAAGIAAVKLNYEEG